MFHLSCNKSANKIDPAQLTPCPDLEEKKHYIPPELMTVIWLAIKERNFAEIPEILAFVAALPEGIIAKDAVIHKLYLLTFQINYTVDNYKELFAILPIDINRAFYPLDDAWFQHRYLQKYLLHFAVEEGRKDLVAFFLDQNADERLVSSKGETPLQAVNRKLEQECANNNTFKSCWYEKTDIIPALTEIRTLLVAAARKRVEKAEIEIRKNTAVFLHAYHMHHELFFKFSASDAALPLEMQAKIIADTVDPTVISESEAVGKMLKQYDATPRNR